jgi:hypothetical protein
MLLVLLVCYDLRKFVLNVFGVDVLTADRRQSFCCVLELALFDKVTRAFWEEKEAGSENDCPEKLDGNGNAVGASVDSILSRVNHDVCEENSNGNAEIVACY